jgi:DNA polymerase elongation subunit (family B)
LAQTLDPGWLVDARYDPGRVTLSFISTKTLQPFHWSDTSFRPYYLVEKGQSGQSVTKRDLFTQEERTLSKITYTKTPPKSRGGWELEIERALSYAYDKGLHFGLVHEFADGAWSPRATLSNEQRSQFEERFETVSKDPLKYSILKEVFTNSNQPIPRIESEKLGLSGKAFSEEEYYKSFILSRIANLPITQTYQSHNVSDWLRSILNTYYRSHDILIPNPDELKLGSTKRQVTGALTIAPESGNYFGMVVLDFESLYPGVLDVYNLSYETIRCPHQECRDNIVPGLDDHVCQQRRGIYSAMIGAQRELRIHHFKPLLKSLPPNSEDSKIAKAGVEILKLLLVSSYGVTVRIHGLASPLMAEAITAYGRHVLQSTFDLANTKGLKPKYGDTDSVFLDNPSEEQVNEFIREVKEEFGLDLSYERRYAVCVLSAAKKAYFGISPSGEPEIKGLTVAKSNSPRFFLKTFQDCLTVLSEGRRSPQEFENAKQKVRTVVTDSIQRLKQGRVQLDDLEYRVELREDPLAKSKERTLPQPYQAVILVRDKGGRVSRGEAIGFVKVHPFKYKGRYFTVKPLTQTEIREVNIEDYVRNLTSSLSQTFEPMGIKFHPESETSLSRFVE